jgi:hypothetical protein
MLPMMSLPVSAAADGTAARLIEIAKNEIGYSETGNNKTKYGKFTGTNGGAWCASFVSWCANKSGIKTSVIPKTASVSTMRSFAEKKGQFISSAKTPKVGDIAIYKNNTSHVDIVVAVSGNNVTTIGGNESNKVRKETWSWKSGSSLSKTQLSGWFRPGYTKTELPKLSAPSITKTNYYGGKTVKITSPTSGSYIEYHYDLGASKHTSGSSSLVKEESYSFNLTSSAFVHAHAEKSGYTNSKSKTASISVKKVGTPEIKAPTYSGTNAHVEITKKSKSDIIIYTTDGSKPTYDSKKGTPKGTSKKYNDKPISVKSDVTIKAIAIREGAATSEIETKKITLATPDMPTAALYQTDEKIDVGSTASVNWSSVANASSYEVGLYKDDSLVRSETTTGNLAAFTLPEVGVYTIQVQAQNFKGNSETSISPITVEAMADVTVSFTDDDGTSLGDAQTIKYGSTPNYPSPHPTKTGYNANGWTIAEGTPITENITIVAQYTSEIYNVEFYDTDGTRIGDMQEVEYLQSAVIPGEDECTVDAGYMFAGWHISPESEGTDYTAVDGDMKVYATQAWENPDLPILVTDLSATKDSTNTQIRYNINVTLLSSGDVIPSGWLMTVLKTADGRMVASKNDSIQLDEPMNIVFDSVEPASMVEVMVVGRNGAKTGGSLSNLSSAPITELATSVWGEWSEWSAIMPTTSDDVQVESKTQYRYNTKETATSTTSKTMSGYTYDKTVPTTGSWSSWSDTKVTETDTASLKRDVETKKVVKNYTIISYGFQRSSSPYYRSYKDTNDTSGTRSSYGVYKREKDISVSTYNNRDSVAKKAKTTGELGGYNDGSKTGFTINDKGVVYFLKSTNNKTQYRYQDTKYVHNFYKISDWSEWTDIKPATYNGLETQTLYRYRTQIPVISAVDAEGEISGTTYNIRGNLDTTADFNGRKATIFVYKETNTDPNEEQREYVGQTTIGDDNAYSFSFIPREEVSAKINGIGTGDFIVALALEGSTELINVDLIEAPKPSYTVTFKSEGNELSAQTVVEGSSAELPQTPIKTGWIFTGWDDSPYNITSNRVLNAQFIPKEYVVVLVDFANSEVDMKMEYSYGSTIELPEKKCEGKTFLGWYTLDGDTKKPVEGSEYTVTDHTLLIADWETAVYTVTFVDENGATVSTQTIEYDEAAEPPAPLTPDNMVFEGWETDSEWWRVTGDITVRPILSFFETVEEPTVIFDDYVDPENPGDYDDTIVEEPVEDETETQIPPSIKITIPTGENTKTFTSIDGIEGVDYQIILPIDTSMSILAEAEMPEGFTEVFTNDVQIEVFSDITLSMMSTADGMNDSNIITIDVPFINPIDEDTDVFDNSKYMSSEWTYALPNDIVNIPVYISDVSGIADMDLDLDFDSSKLTLLDSEQGNAFESNDLTGLLITLKFQLQNDIPVGDYEIVVNASATDAEGGFLDIEASTAVITVFTVGDINGDGELNAKDVTCLRRYQAGGYEEYEETNLIAVDCNGDGEFDAKDVTRLRRYLAGGWDNDSILLYTPKDKLTIECSK